VVDFVKGWSDKTGITIACFLLWLGIATSKWHAWKDRYGKANEHNAWIPRDHWLEPQEEQAIIDFHGQFPSQGYRRLTFMMLDADGVAGSPASAYRVLQGAGLLDRHTPALPTCKIIASYSVVVPLTVWRSKHVGVSYYNAA
jgi:putative transposase